MKLSEHCNISPGYIAEIEIGRKFPSTEMIEKIAEVLRIEPFHLFRNRTGSANAETEKVYSRMPDIMRDEIKNQIHSSIEDILSKY